MQKMNYRPRLVLFFWAMAALGSATRAQDFYWNTAGSRSQALGGTYVASSTDALGALAANPAGLTELRGRNLNLETDAVFARGSFSDSVNSDAPLTNSAGAVPYGAFGMPIGHSRFSFGFGMTPELLSTADWRYVDAPGTAGAAYGLQQQNSAIWALRFSTGVGVSLGSRVSVGATIGADYNENTLHAPYIFQAQPVLAGLKTLLDLHTSGVGWNGSVGLLAKPTRKMEVGVAWKSRTVINSTGTASGDAYAQFAALGVAAPSNFTYAAKVQNVLPQSVLANVAWQVNPRWLLAFQADWVNWKEAFVTLPVTLTKGTNATINSLVGGNSMQDGIPLQWKDQYGFHVGAERKLTEGTVMRFGYGHENNPVPSSTLTPLTAAVLTNAISTGFAYHHGRSRYEAFYTFRPESSAHVTQSSLLAGEYNNSSVSVGTQTVGLSYAFQF
jgi:long-subunit fatty acid transport protein